jgi:hypothetical protein
VAAPLATENRDAFCNVYGIGQLVDVGVGRSLERRLCTHDGVEPAFDLLDSDVAWERNDGRTALAKRRT